ncbi:MAG TPA: sigma 54-interacting transcriptional regulator [Bacillota bacterium]|nr:sigma 54-interacting transcriptional regulator [Bacillota bacterium]
MRPVMKKLPYEWLQEIIKVAAEWVVVVDLHGIVLYINQEYCEFLGTTQDEAVGKPVQQVIENTRMHIVLKTQKAEVASVHPINGSEMIANRYPLYIENQLVGAVGTVIFRNPKEWLDYSRRLQPLLDELKYYKKEFEKELRAKYSFEDLIGDNPKFIEAKRLAEKVSVGQSAVLLTGESGTGKELFAHAIHRMSQRSKAPFIRVNCASIPEHLLESELFGYEEGAFTGAKRGGKKGKFELANRGTIFLDEIGDMPLSMQSKLLRVLQEKEIERVGGQGPIAVDVRIIAATHRHLEEMVEEGHFRRDLYYRLNVIKIELPSLRERQEDIASVAGFLLKKLERKFYRQGIILSPGVIECLQNHIWPGNIRELENVLERAINVLDGKVILLSHLPLYLSEGKVSSSPSKAKDGGHLIEGNRTLQGGKEVVPLKVTLAKVEKEALLESLEAANGNKQNAAKLLGISKTSFYDKCKLYGIDFLERT